MQNISVHLDLTNTRDRIMFDYIKAFDDTMYFINEQCAQFDLGVLMEPIESIVRDYNTNIGNK